MGIGDFATKLLTHNNTHEREKFFTNKNYYFGNCHSNAFFGAIMDE
jgi:hypothetical protein